MSEERALFELTTGLYGFSYERAYIWAMNESKAMEIAKSKFKNRATLELRQLFTSDSDQFCTELSTEGWENK